VTLSPTADVVGGSGVAPAAKGTPTTYTLDKGQFLQIEQDAELTGTPIQTTKPVGVWGGNLCMNIPVGYQACDSAHQQLPPVRALGHEYAAVRPRDRYDGHVETPPWRIVGAVDGTVLTYAPSMPPGAPTTLNGRQVVEFTASDPFVVTSQDDKHPFYMAGYMTGCEAYWWDHPHDCRGDPEFVNVVPPDQFLSSYVFFTDPTYPETHLVVVRAKGPAGFADVTLDCTGPLGGWTAVGSYEYTRVDLVRHDFAKQGTCDNGRHEIKSGAPFGVTVWGWGNAETGNDVSPLWGIFTQAVSYAYPAGASIKPLSTLVVPPTPDVPH
jgi:hypothetical protein